MKTKTFKLTTFIKKVMIIPKIIFIVCFLIFPWSVNIASDRKLDTCNTWNSKIRPDHPRMYFNSDTWPAINQRAQGDLNGVYNSMKIYADTTSTPVMGHHYSVRAGEIPRSHPELGNSDIIVGDYGPIASASAFVYCVEGGASRLKRIKAMIYAHLDYLEYCHQVKQKPAFYWSNPSIMMLGAIDMIWNNLSSSERSEIGRKWLSRVYEIVHHKTLSGRSLDLPAYYGQRYDAENYTKGYYLANNLTWFAGLVFFKEGIDNALALEFLKQGYEVYMPYKDGKSLFQWRAGVAGDDGGGPGNTLIYNAVFYPWAHWNFFYTWRAATGEDITEKWIFMGLHANYLLWNLFRGDQEFGCGDSYHSNNRLIYPQFQHTYLSCIMDAYATSYPTLAAKARFMRNSLGGDFAVSDMYVPKVYPFLMTNINNTPPAIDPTRDLPLAWHFEGIGQISMRSGNEANDTYALFACGGNLSTAHRHYDATHFTIYKKGYLAIDTGSRDLVDGENHLAGWYSQTVAHNSVLIDMPGEPDQHYWGTSQRQNGGQYNLLGSKVIAFETRPHYAYIAGDATATYRSEKCSEMVRQFVFIPPNHFVIFDRVTSARPEYRKTWLLHSVSEPLIKGKEFCVEHEDGRLFCRTLLPERAAIDAVGGPGKEYYYKPYYDTGTNYSDNIGGLKGKWHMEIRPENAHKNDLFLHLIQVGDKTLNEMNPSTTISTATQAGVIFTYEDKSYTVTFSKTGAIGGSIKIIKSGKVLIDRKLSDKVMPQSSLKK